MSTAATSSRFERHRNLHLTLGSKKWVRALVWIVLVLSATAFLLPILWGILTSLKSEADAGNGEFTIWPASGLTLDSYQKIFTSGNVPVWLWNSLYSSAIVTVLTVLISSMAAYAFSRTDFKGKRLFFIATVVSIMVPSQILIVPMFRELLALNLIDTMAGVILPQIVAPVMVFIMKRFFDAVPVELAEAARIDGASTWRIFWTIYLPLARSGLIAVVIFTFIGAWNNFMWPFIVVNNPDLMTIPVGLATVKDAFGIQYAQPMAATIVAGLPLVILFMIFQRHIVKGVATAGLGGQ